jgi:hypothetical protein
MSGSAEFFFVVREAQRGARYLEDHEAIVEGTTCVVLIFERAAVVGNVSAHGRARGG